MSQFTLRQLAALTRAEPATLLALSLLVALAIVLVVLKTLHAIKDSQKELAAVDDSLLQHYAHTVHSIVEKKETIEGEFELVREKWLSIKSDLIRQNTLAENQHNDLMSYTHRATRSLFIVNYGIKSTQLIAIIRETGLLVMRLAEATQIPPQADLMGIIIKLNHIEKDILLHMSEIESCFATTEHPFKLNHPSDTLLLLPQVIDRYAREVGDYDQVIRQNFDAIAAQANAGQASRRLPERAKS
ncbi:hypothetical protein HP532_20100 [Pseudomonas sp. CrR25]|nr:hypothetical protein [Pseudomonas sp. CrR25]